VNPPPPSDAVRKQFFLDDLYCLVLSQFKKYHPFGYLKFDNLGVFQSLKLRNLMGKILQISLKPKFSPNTLGCYGLIPFRKPVLIGITLGDFYVYVYASLRGNFTRNVLE